MLHEMLCKYTKLTLQYSYKGRSKEIFAEYQSSPTVSHTPVLQSTLLSEFKSHTQPPKLPAIIQAAGSTSNAFPMPYVMPIANQPPIRTLKEPFHRAAPPRAAPTAPNVIRATVDAAITEMMRGKASAMNDAANRGTAAPILKAIADVTQACGWVRQGGRQQHSNEDWGGGGNALVPYSLMPIVYRAVLTRYSVYCLTEMLHPHIFHQLRNTLRWMQFSFWR